MKISLKNITSFILAIVMVITAIPFGLLNITAFAEDLSNADSEKTLNENIDENDLNDINTIAEADLLYSDLFYGYPQYLDIEKNIYLSNFHQRNFYALTSIYNDYTSSKYMFETAWKYATKADMTDLIKLAWESEYPDDPNCAFMYNDALDAANEELAKYLLGESDLVKAYSNEKKWLESAGTTITLMQSMTDDFVITDVSELEPYLVLIANNKPFKNLEFDVSDLIHEIKVLDEAGKLIGTGKTVVDIAKRITVALMIEDMRFYMTSDLLSMCEEGTALYDGLNRLKNQLRNGFVSYFVDTYLKSNICSSLLDELADGFVEYACILYSQKSIPSGSIKSIIMNGNVSDYVTAAEAAGFLKTYSVYKKAIEIATNLILKNVPSFDDLFKQVILTEYVVDLQNILTKKSNSFTTQFDSKNIIDFEKAFNIYLASIEAAKSASKGMAQKVNDGDKLNSLDSLYKGVDIYDEYINSVKRAIVSDGQREMNDFGDWKGESVVLSEPTNSVEAGHIYCPYNGFKANLELDNVNVPKNTAVKINGNLTIGSRSSLYVNGELDVNNLTVKSADSGYSSIKCVNDGIIVVKGNVEVNRKLITSENVKSKLYVGGDLKIRTSNSNCEIVLNGTEQQLLTQIQPGDPHMSKNKLSNLSITNPKGVKYGSSIYLDGEYNPNGNPIDIGEYTTLIFKGIKLQSNNNYKEIRLAESITLDNCSFTADVLDNGSIASLSVSAGEKVVINGNLSVGSKTSLIVYGELDVNSLTVKSADSGYDNIGFVNDGIIVVNDTAEINRKLITSEGVKSKLYVGGDLKIRTSNSNCEIVLNGTDVQIVSGSKDIPIVIIENANGVTFASGTKFSALFNHNGNPFTATNCTFVDFDGDGMKDNIDPKPKEACDKEKYSVSTLPKDIKTSEDGITVSVIDINGKAISNTSPIGTGSVVMYKNSDDMIVDAYTAVVPGDVDGDAVITNKDVILIAQNILEMYTPEKAVQSDAMDVFADGKITNRDLSFLRRYLVGKEVLK